MATNVTHEAEQRTETERRVLRPAVEIIESEHGSTLHVELPGVDQASAEVSLDKNTLTIRGPSGDNVPKGFELVHAEYTTGDYERVFTVSSEIDRDAVEASFKNGVLTLQLPREEAAKSTKIEIKAG